MHPRYFFFFFNDTATTEIYTLSLHDALPISRPQESCITPSMRERTSSPPTACLSSGSPSSDRKSTRLNSSHGYISYAVFCLKKKNEKRSPAFRSTVTAVHESVRILRDPRCSS